VKRNLRTAKHGSGPKLKTIQVVLGADLLKAANGAARRLRVNRSELVRDALRAHLSRLDALEKEERERAGYARYPDTREDSAIWDKAADWLRD